MFVLVPVCRLCVTPKRSSSRAAVAHASNPSTEEAGRQPGLQRETLSQKQKRVGGKKNNSYFFHMCRTIYTYDSAYVCRQRPEVNIRVNFLMDHFIF